MGLEQFGKALELHARNFANVETPKLASGVGYVVVFSVFYAVTLLSCVRYHQWWFLGSWGIGIILEIIGYSGRIWYHINDNSEGAYIMELVCVTVAPCFLMAGIYYVLAQLILIYGNHFSRLKPMKYSAIFIVCDVISIFVQAGGGGSSAGSSSSQTGRYVMIAGLAFQVFTMTVFQFLWYDFLWKIRKSERAMGETEFNPIYTHIREKKLMPAFKAGISVTVVLIYTRSIYRLIETSCGWDSYLSQREIYFDILEGLMIGLSGLIMAALSPGLVYGKDAHLYIKKNGFDLHSDIKPNYLQEEGSSSRDQL